MSDRAKTAPIRWELFDKDGNSQGVYPSANGAVVQPVGAITECDLPPQAWVDAKKEIDDGWPDR